MLRMMFCSTSFATALCLLLLLLSGAKSFHCSSSTSSRSTTTTTTTGIRKTTTFLKSSNNPFNTNFGGGSNGDDEDNDEGEVIDLSRQDWRAFRAHLVQTESSVLAPTGAAAAPACRRDNEDEEDNCVPETGDCDLDGIGNVFGLKSTSSSSSRSSSRSGTVPIPPPQSRLTLSSPAPQQPKQQQQYFDDYDQQQYEQDQQQQEQWAYDSGNLIETGAVLLGGVEQEFGFGLRQQYFHKAAILVLDHCEATFTKGIILNRPTDLYMADDINPGVQWRVWFGGDVQGLESDNPDIVCLHSLEDPQAKHASITIMNDLQWTTFDNAKRLVRAGVAAPQDFWVFCGYAGWGAGQLLSELDRQSWYMVATDPNTLLKELARQSQQSGGTAAVDPRDAGLETWTKLMTMIGRGNTAQAFAGDFDDLMLKEWAYQHLLSADAGGGAGQRQRDAEGGLPSSTQDLLRKDPVERLLSRAQAASRGEDVVAGSLVRASSQQRSPFLLHDQELHKSVVLILSDDEQITVGAILNRPAAKGLDIRIEGSRSSSSRKVTLPLRFGGQYSVKEGEPLVWLHCNSVLRAAKVGEPIGHKRHGIWKCTALDVTTAIGQGLATPQDFFVVTGVTVWTKGEGGTARGMQGEIRKGNFEIVPDSKVESVWEALSKQQVLTTGNLQRNLDAAEEAWLQGGTPRKDNSWSNMVADSVVSTFGHPQAPKKHHQDDDEDDVVFQSHVKVSQLSDEALRSWVSIFLLGASASQ